MTKPSRLHRIRKRFYSDKAWERYLLRRIKREEGNDAENDSQWEGQPSLVRKSTRETLLSRKQQPWRAQRIQMRRPGKFTELKYIKNRRFSSEPSCRQSLGG